MRSTPRAIKDLTCPPGNSAPLHEHDPKVVPAPATPAVVAANTAVVLPVPHPATTPAATAHNRHIGSAVPEAARAGLGPMHDRGRLTPAAKHPETIRRRRCDAWSEPIHVPAHPDAPPAPAAEARSPDRRGDALPPSDTPANDPAVVPPAGTSSPATATVPDPLPQSVAGVLRLAQQNRYAKLRAASRSPADSAAELSTPACLSPVSPRECCRNRSLAGADPETTTVVAQTTTAKVCLAARAAVAVLRLHSGLPVRLRFLPPDRRW